MFTNYYVVQYFWAKMDPKMGPRSTQDRAKTGPRSSWAVFVFILTFRFDFASFLDRFGTVLGSQMEPRGAPLNWSNRPVGGPRRSWHRLGSVLFSSCDSGSLFWASRLRVVLGCLWPRFGSSWALLSSFLGTPCSILESSNPICPSIHQRIDPSTRGSSAL